MAEKQYAEFKGMTDGLMDLFCFVEGINKEDALQKYRFMENPWEEKWFCFK